MDASDPAADLAGLVRNRALALGFDAVGFAPADLGPQAKHDLQKIGAQN